MVVIRWEICEAWDSLKKAHKLALEVEREYACIVLHEEDEKVKQGVE